MKRHGQAPSGWASRLLVARCGAAALLLCVACTLAGCGKTRGRERKEVADYEDNKEPDGKVKYEVYVVAVQSGCDVRMEKLTGEKFTIKAHLGCESCRDPNIDECQSTERDCKVVNVRCSKEARPTPHHFNEDRPVRCFPKDPESEVPPRELGDYVRRLCAGGPAELPYPRKGTPRSESNLTVSPRNLTGSLRAIRRSPGAHLLAVR
eukprot:gnl/TRDRNA2_/TRDRNA2_185303_c0_seq1.p1 gnl/TRDRNA2_/TRDRNA2_185303_c0~~gnl/TRDRNA2_/TRDRNA2_185303_c0_seq1.p1  ORF type:complete len:207 (+),score=23.78 gnl/TRDRNA2_/TRDRNA2_185303_c0_seq1:56-676(+)